MNKAEYRTLVGVIDAYLRNEPRRFREAAAWVLSMRTPLPEDRTRLKSRYGYSGYELRTFECMWNLARAAHERLHEPTVPSDGGEVSPEVGAFRTLLLAWLLSKHAGIASTDKKIRPTGMGPMPLPSSDHVQRIEKKYRLSGSPRWWALVGQAWTLVGDPAYMPDADGTTASPSRPTASRAQRGHAPVPSSVQTPSAALDLDTELRRVTRPCDRLALQAYRWAESLDPSREKPERARVDPALWLLIEKGKCPFYPRGNPPSQPTGLKYVRRALSEIIGPRYTRRSGRTVGKSIAAPRDL